MSETKRLPKAKGDEGAADVMLGAEVVDNKGADGKKDNEGKGEESKGDGREGHGKEEEPKDGGEKLKNLGWLPEKYSKDRSRIQVRMSSAKVQQRTT